LKKLLVNLLVIASIAASPIVFGATNVVEVTGQEASHARFHVHSAVDVVILRFDNPIVGLGNKIAEFKKIRLQGSFTARKMQPAFLANPTKPSSNSRKVLGTRRETPAVWKAGIVMASQ
jgi:hypothetical protein